MKPRFEVVLSNPGGELDRRTANDERSLKEAMVDLVESVAYFSDGDTIRVTEHP
jgi:hypothetical protein